MNFKIKRLDFSKASNTAHNHSATNYFNHANSKFVFRIVI